MAGDEVKAAALKAATAILAKADLRSPQASAREIARIAAAILREFERELARDAVRSREPE
ncbi:hypothetical protein [Propylenella binzhouense]|uniref:Uncharacterized protein n=1 Tax=Propylenella binzhouense TaxID=2555902 RepID=A0A964WSK1_9HYPH|nr:hypothetical protein [Propylenella binzhouense]MYZ47058.1 hypothetical protein [Propylenella binzhouense]